MYIYIYIYMVRYHGRARQITGTVFTNQPGLKQAGCPGTVGKRGTIVRFLGRRVNCNLKTCGLPTSGLRCKYGVRQALGNMDWRVVESSNNPAIPNYCRQVVNKWNGGPLSLATAQESPTGRGRGEHLDPSPEPL